VTHSPPPLLGEIFLSPPRGAWASLLAPPAPSGGAWGDASPQTPAIHTMWRMMGKVLAIEPMLPDIASVTNRRGAWGRENCEEFPISTPHDSRDECMAGVWGEASPQAPPEGAGGREKRRAQVAVGRRQEERRAQVAMGRGESL